MRFISPIERYRLIAIHEETQRLADGSTNVLAPGYTVEFKPGDTTDWEREIARQELQLRNPRFEGALGTPLVKEVDPITSVSSFDTNSIQDPELRRRVEEAMLTNADNGNKASGYILVEQPKPVAPWVSYDNLVVRGQRTAEKVAEQNLATAETTGTSLEHLIMYEKANRNDETIVAAYEAALAGTQQAEPDEVMVEA